VALQGTIDAFPVVDVLQLLASAHKTGRLIVEGDRSTAQLFVADGAVIDGGVQGLELSDVADVVVELLRYREGSFLFEPGATPPSPGEPRDLVGVVEAANERLRAWSDVESVVPSMSHRLALVPELGVERVELSAAEWPVVVGAGAQLRVADVVAASGLSELAGCALIADLVGRGVVSVEPPRAELVHVDGSVEVADEAGEQDLMHGVDDAVVVDAAEAGSGFDLVDVQEEDVPEESVGEPAYEVVLLEDEEGEGGSFPERFPIDDLIAAGEEEDPWVQLETAAREERLAAAQYSEDADGSDGAFAGGFGPGAITTEGFTTGAETSGAAAFAPASDPIAPDPTSGGPGEAAASWDAQPLGGFSDLGAFTDPVEEGGAGGPVFVGEGAFSDVPVRTPLAVQEPAADPAADSAADEVLRQMSKLSPKAAEAIAAALGADAADLGQRRSDGDADGGLAGR
jgi:hypothetical protein